MKKNKVMKSLVFVFSLLLLLGIFLWFALPRILHPLFFREAERVQTIPGLREDFIPQGVTKTDDGTILVTGYSSENKASRIYRLEGDGKYSVVFLENEDGSIYKGHAGGITAIGEYVYISNAGKIFILSIRDVMEAKDGSTLMFSGHFGVPCRSSFCSSDGEYLYVGEYHAPGYDTDESHRIENRDGNLYEAITFAFRLDKTGKAETVPSLAYSTCDIVQGFASYNGKVALSLSSGLKKSRIVLYDGSGFDSVFLLDGKEIPLVILDSNRLLKEISAPHMSEDLECRDGALIIAFESSAKKYGMGFVPSSINSIMKMKDFID